MMTLNNSISMNVVLDFHLNCFCMSDKTIFYSLILALILKIETLVLNWASKIESWSWSVIEQ